MEISLLSRLLLAHLAAKALAVKALAYKGICGDHLAAKQMTKVQQCAEIESKLSGVSVVPGPICCLGNKYHGSFSTGQRRLRYVLVAIDYITKWAEAKAMRTINQLDYIKFMDSIVMRFGIPMVLISNNGPQFVGSDFEAYLKELGIKHQKASVAHL
ncbi:uncharacterized protein LOC141665946 [Apium graveolens]|uniref:uncharacterized protein LOC141665946 n=1 Tax=Apium graveolens TaxID=4045 RepID=UPI003D7965AB